MDRFKYSINNHSVLTWGNGTNGSNSISGTHKSSSTIFYFSTWAGTTFQFLLRVPGYFLLGSEKLIRINFFSSGQYTIKNLLSLVTREFIQIFIFTSPSIYTYSIKRMNSAYLIFYWKYILIDILSLFFWFRFLYFLSVLAKLWVLRTGRYKR